MPPPLTHEQCQARMCCLFGDKLKKAMAMSSATELLVTRFCPEIGYDKSNLSLPTGLCSICHMNLYKIRSGASPASWGGPHPPAWGRFSSAKIYGARKCGRVIEKSGQPILCDICRHVRGNPVGQDGSKGLLRKFVPHGEVLLEPQTPVKTNWCQKFAQPTGRGISHPCTPAIRKRNIVSLIEKHGRKETEQILGMGLEDIVDDGKNGVIELASITGKKKKMKVTIGKKKVPV